MVTKLILNQGGKHSIRQSDVVNPFPGYHQSSLLKRGVLPNRMASKVEDKEFGLLVVWND
jgi:hypothetical protein